MKKFQTMGELISYMVGTNAPNELKAEAENQMQTVEEVHVLKINTWLNTNVITLNNVSIDDRISGFIYGSEYEIAVL